LDAKDFDIEAIRLLGTGQLLEYEYDGLVLDIDLGRPYDRDESFDIYIDYIASPSGSNAVGGGDAITSDQGLFFINPRGEDSSKPRQIWTQGETEFNSRWFPTVDKPNERCTQEVYLTVQDQYTTLSNGVLVSSVANGDGTRTDYWVMKQPHAPYLFMVAIGEYAVVRDNWNGKEISYYVEPEYEKDAKEIFAHTKEMMTFFSDLTGIDYPWDKYAQIVVRDYVSGAMENTTSVIFGEFVQKHRRELIDQSNDMIVAHELFHHWFGDYVTCESWANLTMNEGFANYSEYLWSEYKYGRDAADYHRQQELGGYLYQTQEELHPLIHFTYDDKEDMFDQHSYNKGGMVLHMLRHYLGDEAFFEALHLYLTDHAFSSVEVHDLRLAFEEVTGEDLHWFFNQWYLASGHPVLRISHEWKEDENLLLIQIDQVQDPSLHVPVFILPTELLFYYADGTKETVDILINQRSQTVELTLAERPDLVILDPERVLLAIIQSDYDVTDYRQLYNHANSFPIRAEASERLLATTDSADEKISSLLQDPFWIIRADAIDAIRWNQQDESWLDELANIAAYDRHSLVRASAIDQLGVLGLEKYKQQIARGINDTDPFPVVASSIVSLYSIDSALCLDKLTGLKEDKHSDIITAVSTIYAKTGDTSHLSYFRAHLEDVHGVSALDFYGQAESLLDRLSWNQRQDWMEQFAAIASKQKIDPYTRIAATRTIISYLKQAGSLQTRTDSSSTFENKSKRLIEQILAKEPNVQIRSIYQTMLDS
ncbi:MAG: M1 family metallopeptidase, partial [Saprospiraceae bacterium]|nr:M1 family metallopeptidase [Saprospiraceae bacterium]